MSCLQTSKYREATSADRIYRMDTHVMRFLRSNFVSLASWHHGTAWKPSGSPIARDQMLWLEKQHDGLFVEQLLAMCKVFNAET